MLITLGVEDVLSESVAKRLLQEYAPTIQYVQTIGLNGYGQLKLKMPNFNNIAQYQSPVLIITDLDNPSSCPLELIQEWCGNLQVDPNLLLRVAVVEIESWLLADRSAFARWLAVSDSLVPRYPENIREPKERLVNLARRSRRRELREAIVPRPGNTRSTGPGYNGYVGAFVNDLWRPEIARTIAPSLDRAITRIGALAGRYQY